MKDLVRTMQIQRFLGACVSTLVMILWSWAPSVALASDKIAATMQGEGLRLESSMTGGGESSMTGGGAEHSDRKVNPGGISIEDSWSWTASSGTVRIQVAKLVNHRSGGTSGALRLEVWASSSPYNGGSMSGYKIGQVQLSPLAAGFQYTNIDYTVTQLTTPPAGSWYMTMIASEFTGSALNDGFSFVDWEAMTPNWVIGSSVAYVTVVEFYNQFLNHYFRTANAGEAAWVDGGGAGPGWIRTGDNFTGYVRNAYPSGAFQVYRFYGSVSPGPNSHFYTAFFTEYQQLINLQAITPAWQPRWNYEEVAFAIDLPTSGVCPARAPTRIYRAYNNRFAQNDSNHRYTTSLSAINQLVLQGWLAEGVVMCAV